MHHGTERLEKVPTQIQFGNKGACLLDPLLTVTGRDIPGNAHAIENDNFQLVQPRKLPSDLVETDFLGDFLPEKNKLDIRVTIGILLLGRRLTGVLVLERGNEALRRICRPGRADEGGGGRCLGDAFERAVVSRDMLKEKK